MTLVSFGREYMIHVTGIGFRDPALIIFKGYLDNNGSPVELIQNVSQVNVTLWKLKRREPEKPKRPIGFV